MCLIITPTLHEQDPHKTLPDGFDMVLSKDLGPNDKGPYVCTCLLLLRPSNFMLDFLNDWQAEIATHSEKDGGHDQVWCNHPQKSDGIDLPLAKLQKLLLVGTQSQPSATHSPHGYLPPPRETKVSLSLTVSAMIFGRDASPVLQCRGISHPCSPCVQYLWLPENYARTRACVDWCVELHVMCLQVSEGCTCVCA